MNSLLAPTVNLGERLPASAHPFADRINPFLERRTAWRNFKPTSLKHVYHLRLIEAQEHALRPYMDAVAEFDGRRAIYGIAALPISE